MSKILEMRERRANLWDATKAFLNEHTDEKGMMSAEDSATYEKMEQDIVDLGKAIEREERVAAMDAEMNAPTTRALNSKPQRSLDTKSGRASDGYKKAFWGFIRDRSGRMVVTDDLEVGTNTEGGYLVPDEYERTLVQALEEQNVLRPLCTVIRTESGTRKIPVVTAHGNAQWMDEEEAYTPSDEVFGQVTLGANKVGTIIKVSEELLNDSVFDLPTYLANEFARRIGAAEEEAFITGNGTSKPTGILHATNGAGVGVTAASATAFTADEVLDLTYSLKEVYRRNACYLMNDSTVKALRKLKDGQGQYLWQPGLKEGQPDTLLGYRIVNSSFCPTIATGTKPIIFGDLKYYWIADREGRTFQRLNELYAANGQVGFRAYQRVDGRVVLPEAIKCLQMA
ncbi:MAG: phage major capsid protein [Lachnospiraceae bacterium]|nr:phage major capsid protein [Lachnospiraceae bacterium]